MTTIDETGKVWVSVNSHRARHHLQSIAGDETGHSYGVWPVDKDGHVGWPRGEYYLVPVTHTDRIASTKGLTILKRRPKGDLFRRI